MSEGTVQVDAERYRKLEAMEAKQKASARRANVKLKIFAKKAMDAGIKVSKTDVDAWIAAEDARKASSA